MRALVLPIVIGVLVNVALSQSISIAPLSRSVYCPGESISLSYSATGTFNADNVFVLQLSDPTGSFTAYTILGRNSLLSGVLSGKLENSGKSYRLRVASSSPYTLSPETPAFTVGELPSGWVDVFDTVAKSSSVFWVDNPIRISAKDASISGSMFLWTLFEDANPKSSTDTSFIVRYPTIGTKSISLTEFNSEGCSRSTKTKINVVSCHPQISSDVWIVTGQEGDLVSDPRKSILVKAGARLEVRHSKERTIFVESGGSVYFYSNECICYAKAGAAITPTSPVDNTIFVLERGASLGPTELSNSDTVYCENLQFDYSQIPVKHTEIQEKSQIQIQQLGDNLLVSGLEQSLNVQIFNLLGETVLEKQGKSSLQVQLSRLPTGVYLARASTGAEIVTKRIAIVR